MARGSEGGGISRRTVLVGGGAGAGLLLAWSLWPRTYQPNLHVAEGEIGFNAFLKIAKDGRVIVAVPQAEIGQGVYTSLPQILADELGADWRTVAVEPAPISPLYANTLLAEELAEAGTPSLFQGVGRWAARHYATREALMMTGGSTSVRAFDGPMREAGAAARALLQMEAAARWSTDWQNLDAHSGFVWNGPQRIPFAELAEAAAARDLPEDLPIRGGSANRLAGQPLPRLDAPAKLDGTALFAADVRLPNMLYAAVRSGPPGSRLAGLDKAAAERVPGALHVVENLDWVAVAGLTSWAAQMALDALRPRFEGPAGPSDADIAATLARALGEGEPVRVAEIGAADAAPGASTITAQYSAGPAPNAALEPLVATARATGDRLEIWAPTQAPALARAAAARAAGLPTSNVTLYPTFVGSGYGRKIEMDAIAQAAVLTVKLGRPVQLTWPRVQEIAQDRMRPPAAARIAVEVVAGGRIQGWEARIAAPATATEVAERLGVPTRIVRPDRAAAAGAVPPYAIPRVLIDHVPAAIGMPTGLSRGGAHAYTCFFTESMIDEVARAAGIEPLSFRMGLLGSNPRLARALTTATSIGGWDGGQRGSSMGLAALSAYGSHIGTLVEIEIGADQRIRVTRAVCAVDCGRVVNPDIVRQQIEGGLIHGISAALAPPLTIANGTPMATNISELGLLSLRDAPEVSVKLLDSDEDPGGITELAVPTAAPAIANALHALTGGRLRHLPLRLGS